MVTTAQIKAIAGPGAKPALVAAVVRGWPEAVAKAKLTTKNRACHFLAQIMTETGGLRIVEESGAYKVDRILHIFGQRHSAKIGPAEARRIAALPVAQRGPVLFNRVYGIGNPKKMREFNNTGPNDGWLYRGGGMMQCTGKSNYASKEKKTGLPLVAHPELLHNPDTAFKAAYLEWIQDGRCNAAADRDDVVVVRKIINGGDNGLAECRAFLAKAKRVLADYDASAIEQESEPDTLEVEVLPEDAPPNVQPVDPAVRGDPVLFDVQTRLKARRYPPGVLDGKWGGGTSGALSGFMNDRGLPRPPTSLAEFHKIADEVRAELLEAETEGWYRPVSEARANADSEIVKELAPETVPAKRNLLVTVWGAISAFFAAIWDTISGYVSEAWNFFTDHKDVVDDHPGIMSTVWDRVAAVPSEVWLIAGGCGLAFVAYNSWRAIKTSTQAVTSGERQ